MAERDDSGNESEGENVCEGLDQGSANSEQVRPTWEVIFSDGSDSETVLMTWSKLILHHVNLSALIVAAMIQLLQHKRRVMGLLQTPRRLDWLRGTKPNGNTSNFLQNRGVGYKLRTCYQKSEGLTRYINRMLDGPLSSFELLVDNSMLTHIQQNTEAEAHRVKNSDEWKLPLSKLKAFISLLYVRGALCGNNRPILEFWDKNWRAHFFQKLWVEIAFAK